MDYRKNNLDKKDFILHSTRAAISLWGICPSLRMISIGWNGHSIDIYFIYNGIISDDDAEISECIATEVLATFPDDSVKTHHIRCDSPNPIPLLGSDVIFAKD